MELLDIYDIDRKKTGRIISRGDDILPGEYLMVVHLCVFNMEKKMLIQRRALTKDRYPGIWDLSAGGFARSGESSLDAVIRESGEELGLSCERDEFRFLFAEPFRFIYDDMYIMVCELDINDITVQAEEICELRFESPENVIAMIERGEFVDYPIEMMKKVFAGLKALYQLG